MLDLIQSIAIIAIAIIVIIKEYPRLTERHVNTKQRMAVLDSCALIDGRVVELAKAGFVPYELAVPEFVIAELQLLADGNDSQKRERARYGLEIVQQLQHTPEISLQIERTSVSGKTIDDKLIALCKKIGADLFTNDFNLNQVASIEGVRVLNINELSHAMRPVALPGEGLSIKIVQAGSNRDQGVGYLEDGTMVVVDNARKDIGKSVSVRITRTHQTVAGKMLFAAKQGTDSAETAATQKVSAQASKQLERTTKQHANQKHQNRPAGNKRTRRSASAREASLLSAIDEMADKN